jgi:hypothetical protein
MNQALLFSQLRHHLMERVAVPANAVTQVPDTVIWTAYTTCYACAQRLLTDDQLAATIAASTDLQDFLTRLEPQFVDHQKHPALR